MSIKDESNVERVDAKIINGDGETIAVELKSGKPRNGISQPAKTPQEAAARYKLRVDRWA